MASHYFIGIKGPSDFESLVNAYKDKYQLTETYKVITHPDDLHVTLLFIGAMSDQSLPFLTESLRLITKSNPAFNIYFDGLSYFGSPSSPRVVYFSVKESPVLTALQKEIDKTVSAQLDRSVSDRFTPHMTIAKKRKATDPLHISKEQWNPIEMPITSFSLFKIHPEMTPKYEAIVTFKLG